MKPTAKQVAHAAGVSLSAVSRAFAPDGSLDPDKKKRILALAHAMGYVSPARRTAEAIARNTITLVTGDLLNPFYPMVLDMLARQLQAVGRQLLVYALPGGVGVDAVTDQILAARPSGIIVTSAQLTSRMTRACHQHRIRVVLMNRIQRDIRIPAVTCDNYGGGRDAAALLLSRGRQRIGFVAGLADTSTHTERARGFRDMLNEAGQSPYLQADGAFSYQAAHTAVSEMIAGQRQPDALFCCNDIMALGAIDAVKARGMRPGEDIAIVGFDDIPMAAWGAYRLSTIRQPVETMVRETVNLLLDEADTPPEEGGLRIVPGKLIIRASA
ncbi:MAG: substrate-binding domain-containing protein [Rhodobacteraceae bacterium]|jgi:DNA-binding LacI/PurR family transcriptional regulator|nr:substrate-binding domain-containing protein [Paracoccaceae bacterium]